ncbi:UNVERIFIED_CONTAM: DNA polymerase III subunit gamma/tau [Campylobacter lari]
MNYKALYRKYRPKSFDDVKGQDHIVQTLKNIIKSRKISHAYLFSGPRGVGKTSLAKIFASVINCYHNSEDVTKLCEVCQNMMNQNLDIIEMDAASNNGVDSIRELKEKIEHLPSNGSYKVYIIDEVHMLSKGAFNALLKTLEEPPAHAIFILATTDPQKIPPTIISRLQRFNFRKISTHVIVEQLKKILEKEKIKFDEKTLHYIARLATGGLRDALSIVDQANAYGNGEIKLEDVTYAFGITSNENLINLINNCYRSLNEEIITLVNELKEAGIDGKQFVCSLIDVLKDFLIFNRTNDKKLLDLLINEEIELLTIDEKFVLEAIELLYKLNKELYYTDNDFQLIQLYLIKLSSINKNATEIVKEPIKQHLMSKETKEMPLNLENKQNQKDTLETVLTTTQELVIEANQIEDNNEIIEDDILTGTFDLPYSEQNDVLIDTREFNVTGEIFNNAKEKIIPEFGSRYHLLESYIPSYSDDDLKRALILCDFDNRNKAETYLQIIINDDDHTEFNDLKKVLNLMQLKGAGSNFLVLTSDNIAALNYLKEVSNRSNVQNYLKEYFNINLHLICFEKNKFKQVAGEVKDMIINNQVNKNDFKPFSEVNVIKEDSPSRKLFNKLNF